MIAEMTTITSRQANEVANELKSRGGYEPLVKHWREQAVLAAQNNKGIIEIESDNVILSVLKQMGK